MTLREIAEKVQRSKSTVGYIVKKFKKTGSVERKSGSGRKNSLNENEISYISNIVKEAPRTSAEKIKQKSK
jgi:transposase